MDILRILLCAFLITTALSAPVSLNGVGEESDETELDSDEIAEAGAPEEEELEEEEPAAEEPATVPPQEAATGVPPQDPTLEVPVEVLPQMTAQPALVSEAPNAMLETATAGNYLPSAPPDPAAIGLDNPTPLPDVVVAAEDPQLSTDIDPSMDLSIAPASPLTDNSIAGRASPGMEGQVCLEGSQNAVLPEPVPALDVAGTAVEPLPIVLATVPQGTPPPSYPSVYQTAPPTSAITAQLIPVATQVEPNGIPVCFTIQFTRPPPETSPPRGDV